MNFIDLFAGLGGFHLALSRLGHQCVFASEIQPKLQKLYRLNFPDVPIMGDITKIKAVNLSLSPARSRDLKMSWVEATSSMRFVASYAIITPNTFFSKMSLRFQDMMEDVPGK